MAFDPKNNPITNTEKNGKKHRYATRTTCARTLRTDPEAERAMWRIKQILSRPSALNALVLDTPSFSLVVRRSLKLYSKMLLDDVDGGVIEREKNLVRQSSHVPSRRRSDQQDPS